MGGTGDALSEEPPRKGRRDTSRGQSIRTYGTNRVLL